MELLKSTENFSNLYVESEFLNDFTSMATRSTYKQVLNYFFEFIGDRFKSVHTFVDIERNMVVEYKNFISEAGGIDGQQMAPNTIGKHLAAISSYFDYLATKDLVQNNPARTVKRPRFEVVKPTKALSLEQVEELFASVSSKESGPLHLALIATLWLTGMRKAEVLNLKRKDYYKENSDVVIQYKGKGGKFRRKLVHPRLEIILDEYLSWMKEKNREQESEDWLFQPTKNPSSPDHIDKPINPRTLNRIIEKYSKKIGLNFNVSAHSARATFISLLLNEEVPIADVAREVAHSSIKTTQEYDKRRKTIKQSLVRKLPL
jgi:site-specific recombinase XerD